MIRDYKDKQGKYFFKNNNYKVITEFYSSGVVTVNYSYIITYLPENKVVLSGNNFNPSINCKIEDDWPRSLGWRGIGELLREVCDLPKRPSTSWIANRTADEIDWLSDEDACELKGIGEGIVISCVNLTFQV